MTTCSRWKKGRTAYQCNAKKKRVLDEILEPAFGWRFTSCHLTGRRHCERSLEPDTRKRQIFPRTSYCTRRDECLKVERNNLNIKTSRPGELYTPTKYAERRYFTGKSVLRIPILVCLKTFTRNPKRKVYYPQEIRFLSTHYSVWKQDLRHDANFRTTVLRYISSAGSQQT